MENSLFKSVYNPDVLSCIANLSNDEVFTPPELANKIIDMLQLLGNCSNSNAYDYTQQDVDKIFVAIENEVREAKKKFSKIESKKGSRFSLE